MFSRHDLSELCSSFRPLRWQSAQGGRAPIALKAPHRQLAASNATLRHVACALAGDGLHSVAFENLLAASAQAGPLHLKTVLHGTVIAEVLPAEALCIARARALFRWRTGMLRQRGTAAHHGSSNKSCNRNIAHCDFLPRPNGQRGPIVPLGTRIPSYFGRGSSSPLPGSSRCPVRARSTAAPSACATLRTCSWKALSSSRSRCDVA
ncbi:hypothetical protein ACVWZM_003338 [Bradyrhizobium sp. USDA 4501]